MTQKLDEVFHTFVEAKSTRVFMDFFELIKIWEKDTSSPDTLKVLGFVREDMIISFIDLTSTVSLTLRDLLNAVTDEVYTDRYLLSPFLAKMLTDFLKKTFETPTSTDSLINT